MDRAIEALTAGLIKVALPENESRKLASYISFYLTPGETFAIYNISGLTKVKQIKEQYNEVYKKRHVRIESNRKMYKTNRTTLVSSPVRLLKSKI
ncbi:hypothetical protein AGMMS50239_22180 [Bacteroidia bacterium]|nr:hypothetical protein AGMMS50239_22180 [Bacteroidia bacterium]